MASSLLVTLLALGACQLLISPACGQANVTTISDVLALANFTSLRGAVNQTGISLAGFTGVLLAPTDAAFAQVSGPVPNDTLRNILLYHALTTTELPLFNASDALTTVGNFSEPRPYPGAPAPGWPTLLNNTNITITLSPPDASGATPYWFYGYANQSAQTTSAQCLNASTGNTTTATVCIIDRVLIPVPANETIANYLSSQPSLSTATQLALQDPIFAESFVTPDVVATFFVPTNSALTAYVERLAAQNLTSTDPRFNTVVANTLGGHFGLSVVPFNGTGSKNLLSGFTNTLVANGTGVTSVLANGTRVGPVPIANGTRVGKAYVYTINTVLETGAAEAALASPGTPAPAPGTPAPAPGTPAPAPGTNTTGGNTTNPSPSPRAASAGHPAWVSVPMLLASALLCLML